MKTKIRARRIAFCSVFTALLAVCAWISIPSTPPFTLQSFAVLLTAAILPLDCALAAYSAYFFLGILGFPVFSSFTGGISVLVGPTGGYLIGFFLTVIVVRFVISHFGFDKRSLTVAFLLGNVALYVFAAMYYSALCIGSVSASAVLGAFSVCVLPFIPFDIIKLAAALAIAPRLERLVVI